MALVDFKLLPGIDKQQTQVGADRRWVSCDNVRFRYGLPEKVGGWSSLLTDTIVGVARPPSSDLEERGSKEDHPPIFSGSPYRNLTLSELTQRLSAPT